jgi:hypothetical protein
METNVFFEGKADEEALFDIAFTPFWETKKMLNYAHNGKDKLELELV